MPAMVWVVLALIILCMAIPYGKLYLWDRPRRRSKADRTAIEIEGEQAIALIVGVGAGIFFGWCKVGALCQESLSSIRHMPQSDHDQPQSSQTRGASPAASEVEVQDQEPIAVAPNSTRSATVEPVGVTSA